MTIEETFDSLSAKVQKMYSARDKIIERLEYFENWDGYAKNTCTLTEIPDHIVCVVRFYSDSELKKTQIVKPNTDATPPVLSKTGYTLIGWSKSYANVTTNVETSAIWQINQYDLTLQKSPASGGTTYGGGRYDYLTNVTISSEPNSDYWFRRWSDYKPQAHTICLSCDTTLTAYFQEVTCIATEEDSSVVYSENGNDKIVTENSILV